MTLIIREHSARYSLRESSGAIIGQIVQGQHGWMARDSRGYGPRQPRSSAYAALELATSLEFFAPAPWRDLVRLADQKFKHNEAAAGRDAR